MAKEVTLVLLKPDAIERDLDCAILGILYSIKGVKKISKRVYVTDRSIVERHYAVHQSKPFFPWLVDQLCSGLVVAVALEGEDIIAKVRKICGATDPSKADRDTIRGKYADDDCETANREGRAVRNLVHSSDSPETANYELSIWFRDLHLKNEIKEMTIV